MVTQPQPHPQGEIADRIMGRASLVEVAVSPSLAASLEAFLGLLAHLNHKMNLTALGVEPVTDEAIDRLIVEPLAAVRHLQPEDRLAVDIGSGGGSPAIPLKLAVPALRMTLVESRIRKAAFLREAIRRLGLANTDVENRRVEEYAGRAGLPAADIVTVRGVRLEPRLLGSVTRLISGGRLLWFTTNSGPIDPTSVRAFDVVGVHSLLPALGSQLVVLRLGQ